MNKFIGNKKFYRMVLVIAIPIMIQNGITNFVGLLDNIMVGQIGTEPMSGVAIVNQLLFVFNLCLFGALSGPGIFGAQFYGQENHEGIRQAFRFKIIIALVILGAAAIVFNFFGGDLINAYLQGNEDAGDKTVTLAIGKEYLSIMLIGLIPFAITQIYASTLRETNQTLVPMVAGLTAVLVNLVLNYILIFGSFGAPKLGAAGAAIATVISRFVECGFVVIWTHTHSARNPYILGMYRRFRIEKHLLRRMAVSGLPLMVNEALWSGGMALLNQFYSLRGNSVVAATNISSTIFNLFAVAFIALGTSVGIIVGQLLGASKFKEAKETDTRLIAFTVFAGVVMGGIMAVLAPLFPELYNTTEEVRSLAATLMVISGCMMPLHAFMHSAYFTIRSGGRTIITFLFDCGYTWVIAIPLAFVLTHCTDLSIVWVYALVQGADLLKGIVGFILLKKGVWVRNIVKNENSEELTA